jgi:hypothetical protein
VQHKHSACVCVWHYNSIFMRFNTSLKSDVNGKMKLARHNVRLKL